MLMKTPPSMAEALALTRAGRLAEAAAVLKAALTGDGARASGEPTPEPTPPAPGELIDLTPVSERATPRPATPTARQPAPAPASPPASKPAPRAAKPGAKARSPGRTEERTHSGPTGHLAYQLYIPADAAGGMPLVVMLHGCTQSPEDFARGTGMNRLADEIGFLVAYPRQTQAANMQKCWNWFRPGDQQRDCGEPALIAGLTRAVIAAEQVDPARVYVAGLSAGGAAAAIMAAAYPDIYAAVGIHSGLDCGAAYDMASALAAMRSGTGGKPAIGPARRFVPLITFHGDGDSTVHEINSREIVAAASLAAGGNLVTRDERGASASGRRFTRAISTDGNGRVLIEQWTVHGAGHAWSGGNQAGSYTDPNGPDASREMVRFFLDHTRHTPG